MTITAIAITYGRTINLGDYNSARIDITLEAELDEFESVETALTELWQRAKENVKAQALPLVKKQADEVREIFAGLPPEVREDIIAGRPAKEQEVAHHRPNG